MSGEEPLYIPKWLLTKVASDEDKRLENDNGEEEE